MIATDEHIDRAVPRLWELLGRLIDPGERLTIDAWAEKNLRLSSDESRFPGPIKMSRTPYMVGPLRALTHPEYRRIVLCWAGQTGKTTIQQIFLSHCIDQNPGPAMLAFPNQKLGKQRSRKHLQPLIRDNAILSNRVAKRNDALQNFEFSFDRMTTNIAWAGSSTMLSSEAIRWLIRDEIDKWKHLDKSEGHPVDLSEIRVTSYDELARILDASTPAMKTGKTWQAFENGTGHRFFVPCPLCGKPDRLKDLGPLVTDRTVEQLRERLIDAGFQVLEHNGFTGHEDITDPDEVRKRTVYRCEHCKGTFPHSEVRKITQHGRWIPQRVGRTIASFQLPRWYRDLETCSFGECQAKYVEAKTDPVELQNWINSYAAEGWEERGAERSKDEIRAHCRGYEWQTIPFVPLYIFATVDIRDTEIHAIVRAWSFHETSALLGNYLLPRLSKFDPTRPPTGESIGNVDTILSRLFVAPDGHAYGVTLTGIDSGYDADEVYEFCRTRARCVAMKGDEKLSQTIGISRPMKIWGTRDPAPDSPHLVAFQSGYFSDVLNARLNVSAGAPGDWMLPAEIGEDYVKHMISERKVVIVNKWGRAESRWKKFGLANHWRDCEKMQFVLARMVDIRSHQPAREDTAKREATPPTGFLGRDTSGFVERLRR